MPPDVYAGLGTEHRLLELEREILAQIGTSLRTGAFTAACSTEQVPNAEELSKDVAQILECVGIEASSPGTCYSSVSKAIVGRAFVGVDQHRVRFGDFLEFLFRIRIIRIPVGMVLHGQLTVGALNLLLGAGALHSQDLVVIAFDVARDYFLLRLRRRCGG